MQRAAVGVFDSGVGGLSVLSHIHRLLPAEELIYVADSAYIPYGCKKPEQVLDRSLKISDFLVKKGVKAIVVACNTATAVAVHELRARYDVPVIGMEPAVKPAVGGSISGVVGVLATSGTLGSEKFNQLKQRYADQVELIVQPCPGLVEQIEAGEFDGGKVKSLLDGYLQPLLERGMDTLVLGCTHYTFVLPLIRKIVGEPVTIIDAGDAIARQLRRQLHERAALVNGACLGSVKFWSSGTMSDTLISSLWGQNVHVEHLDI